MGNKRDYTKQIWIVIIIILALLFLLYCIKNGEIVYQNELDNNSINANNNFITKYTWNEKDIKTFYNTYYVDRGYEDEPIEMQYVLLRCETQKGDLEAGTYHFETDETIGANFLVYIVDEQIDLNTYEGNEYEQVCHGAIESMHITKDLEIKQGQYIYLQAGFNPKGTITMEKRQ